MRSAGVVHDTRGLGPQAHACWRYRDPVEFRTHARDFLADGLRLGLRPMYVVAADDAAPAVGELRRSARLDRALDEGDLRITPLDSAYADDAVIEPGEQVDRYAAATDEAVAAGFAGLRVAAEVTPLVRTAPQAAAFTRYEHLVDRYMTARPFSALCGYDQRVLGEDTITRLAVMHPHANSDTAGFRLHGSPLPGCAAALGGQLDLLGAEHLGSALDRADLPVHDATITLDATGLEFVDHRSLITLAEHAGSRGATLVLRTAHRGAARITDLLGLDGVRVELPA
ncbi:MEDS domain-containing protein [Actinokineospora spheciospongiae]|uniref:MEDS domain-containing protein n=1 Tax=Actinokineospora spheciospongiae TaxID=909613 RepID=UPI000D71BB4F|nr:MEDS domain-containing protein [Actinokineospora spheciospongiae]PWW62737.1 STAS domain-containing protein [Actinokineospora spheciospongiae]